MKLHTLAAALTALACLTAPAGAENGKSAFPKTITVIVPFSAGSTTDLEARTVAERLSVRLGIRVIVENRDGAQGAIGTEYVSRSKADGSTLLMLTNGVIGTAAMLPQSWKAAEFTPVAGIACSPLILAVSNGVPATTVSELIAHGKASLKGLDFGKGGTSAEVAALLFARHTGIKIQVIHYRADPAGVVDLMAGRIQAMFVIGASGLENAKAGKIRPLAVVNPARSRHLPKVPTLAEVGVPLLQEISGVMPCRSLVAPPETPLGIADRLSKEVGEIMAEPEIVPKFSNIGSEPVARNRVQTGAYIAGQVELWTRLVKEHNLAPAR